MGTADSSIDFYKTLARSPRVILPSLLACDFANLERDIRELEKAGVQGLHLDVMDGHFVPNLSIGVPVVEAVRRVTDLVLDVHLMLSDPEFYFEPFRKAGADGITFHVEAIADLGDLATITPVPAASPTTSPTCGSSSKLTFIQPSKKFTGLEPRQGFQSFRPRTWHS